MNFADRLIRSILEKKAPCVVGLDTTLELMPAYFLRELNVDERSTREEKSAALLEYNRLVIDQVHDIVPAVKPNSAFYEWYGADGIFAIPL